MMEESSVEELLMRLDADFGARQRTDSSSATVGVGEPAAHSVSWSRLGDPLVRSFAFTNHCLRRKPFVLPATDVSASRAEILE